MGLNMFSGSSGEKITAEFKKLADNIFLDLQKDDFEILLRDLLNFGNYLIENFPDKKVEEILKALKRCTNIPSYELDEKALIRLGAMATIATNYYSDNDEKSEQMVAKGDYSLVRTYEAWKKAAVIFAAFGKRPGGDSKDSDLFLGLQKQVQGKTMEWQEAVIEKINKIVMLKSKEEEIKRDKRDRIKKEMLDKLMDKISDLQRRGGQHKKLSALFEIYEAFKKLNLSDSNSINECKKSIRDNLDNLEGFSSSFGKLGAFLKQSIFQTGRTTTMSDTRLLVGKLNDWIEKNSYPEERIRDQIRGRLK